MSRIIPILLSLFTLFVCCSQNEYEDVLVRFSGTIPEGEYWWSTFTTFPYSQTSVEFDLISGAAVDIIVLDREGFLEFENRIVMDTFFNMTWVLQVEEFVVYSFYADSGQRLHARVWCPIDSITSPVDFFLFDSENFSLYLQGERPNDLYAFFWGYFAEFDFDVVQSESLYFVIDNTSYLSPVIGWACYRLDLCEYIPQAFSYYEQGSSLNTNATTYSFNASDYDSLYIVVNNAGFVDGGANPMGPVEFSISVLDENIRITSGQ